MPISGAILASAILFALVVPWARRGIRFWIGVFPILLSYLFLFLRTHNTTDDARALRFAALHDAMAPRALKIITGLSGGYVKMGQVLSNRGDVLPQAYVRAFATLQDQCPPRAWSKMEALLREDACAVGELIDTVDEAPLGAASTGQAHLATLRDGRRVVLKIQYPEAKGRFQSDFGNVQRLVRIALPALVPVIREVRRRFAREFEYDREAADLLECRASMRRHFGRRVALPDAYPELGSRRVLVMEYLAGEKLVTDVQTRLRGALGDAGYEWLRATRLGVPPPPGAAPPTALQKLRAAPRLWALRRRTRRRLRLLVDVHGHQMLVDGVFNADPHPGNVLLMPDGRLGLIDYGQVMRLSDAQRRTLAALLVALAAQDEAAAVAGATAMGFRTRRMDPAVLAQLAAFFFDRDDYDRFGVEEGGGGGGPVVPYSPARTLKRLNGADKLVVVPEEYILAARVSLLLRGTSQLMAQQRVRTAVCWRGYARRALRETEGVAA